MQYPGVSATILERDALGLSDDVDVVTGQAPCQNWMAYGRRKLDNLLFEYEL